MAKVTFDGPSLTITIVAGTTEIDVKDDLYSEWKNWQLLTDNQKYPQAFRTVGGDPLTPGISAGAYFFINNIDGWRLKPAEEDATVLVAGNLAPEDSSIPILVPTIGDFSVLIQGLQPITQSVETILLQQQDAAYNGEIAVDFINGQSGSKYPTGTASTPVNNVADAFILSQVLGIRTFIISNGTFLLDRTAEGYNFIGNTGNPFFDINGYNVGGSIFNNLNFSSNDLTNTTSNISMINCSILGNIVNFAGSISQSGIGGNISFKNTTGTVLSYCFTTIADGSIELFFDMQGNNVQISIRAWSGNFEIVNLSNALSNVNIDLIAGKLVLNNSNTNGNLILRGVGDITDTSNGTSIIRDGFIEGTDVIQLREYIYIDTLTGIAGTGENNGILTNPVNNIQDAYNLSQRRGIKKFRINGTVILDQDYEQYVFEGSITKNTAIIDCNNYSVSDSEFINVTLTGDGTGEILADFCKLDDLRGVSGIIKNTGLKKLLLPGNNTLTTLIDCFSEVVGTGTPVLDLGDLIDSDLQVRGYNGGIELRNVDVSTQNVSVDFVSGHAVLDSTCTEGQIVLRGSGWINDNSGPNCIVVTAGLLGNATHISAYNERVTINTANGKALDVTLDGNTTTYPIGTDSTPVNNLADALTIAGEFGLTTFDVVGTLIVTNTEDVSGLTFHGRNPLTTVMVLTPGCVTERTDFEDMIVTGAINGSVYFRNVAIQTLVNIGAETFPSVFERCIFRKGVHQLRAIATTPQNIHFIECVSGDPGNTRPTLDFNNNTGDEVAIRKYGGGINIINYTGGQESTIDLSEGKVDFDSSNTNGSIVIRGIGSITDNSNTLTLDTSSLVQYGPTETILQTIVANQGTHDIKLDRILGLSQHNFRIINQTYDGNNNLTSSTIRLYDNSTDADNNTNPTYEYVMVASYDVQSRILSYKVTEI